VLLRVRRGRHDADADADRGDEPGGDDRADDALVLKCVPDDAHVGTLMPTPNPAQSVLTLRVENSCPLG